MVSARRHQDNHYQACFDRSHLVDERLGHPVVGQVEETEALTGRPQHRGRVGHVRHVHHCVCVSRSGFYFLFEGAWFDFF